MRSPFALPRLEPSTPPPALDRDLLQAVSRQVPRGAKVAVLAGQPWLADALRAAGCDVLPFQLQASPAADEELRKFAPACVLVDGLLARHDDPVAALKGLAELLPGARWIFAFDNALGAHHLLSLLTGARAPTNSMSEDQLCRWLDAAGLSVTHREPVATVVEPVNLAGDAEVALRNLLVQLNPSSRSDRLLLVAQQGTLSAPPTLPDLTPGLLSVVIRNHRSDRIDLLDKALFSLACQQHRPLEVVVVTQSQEPGVVQALEAALARYDRLAGWSRRVLWEPSHEDIRARLVNVGVRAAKGQYLAFLDDDDVVYPDHYRRLIEALRASNRAWAIGAIREVRQSRAADGHLHNDSKAPLFEREKFERADLVNANFVSCHSYVLDRLRLGRFPVEFAEETSRHEDYIFVLRLAALFRPILLNGRPTAEYRIRNDGTNTVLAGSTPESHAQNARAWRLADLIKDAAKSAQVLITLDEYERDLDRHWAIGRANGRQEAVQPLHNGSMRYRVVDEINSAMKRVEPVHRLVKAILARRIR